jgi:hypothetical protein
MKSSCGRPALILPDRVEPSPQNVMFFGMSVGKPEQKLCRSVLSQMPRGADYRASIDGLVGRRLAVVVGMHLPQPAGDPLGRAILF